MSRSRRKKKIFGISTAETEKQFKAQEHSRERANVRDALNSDREIPHPKKFGNRWAGPKDGRQYWKKATAKDMRK
jgi:hypothetical protein